MIKALLKKSQQPAVQHMRRVGDVATHQQAVEAAQVLAGTPAALSLVASGLGDPLQAAGLVGKVRSVESMGDVGSWRSTVPGVVSENDQVKCVVLDREYSSVLVLATSDFYRSGAHSTLLTKIAQKKLSVEAEIVTTAEVISKVILEGMKRGTVTKPVKDDDRNLALYEDLIRGAFNLRASDLHFEMDKGPRSRVLLRRYGRMRPWKDFDTGILMDAVAAGYNGKTKSGTASGASWASDRSLNTITEHKVGEKNINGRFSTYPVVTGLDVVVRLLESDPNGRVLSLEQLGYADSQITGPLRIALKKNSGFLGVVGSTGSGKSTTLKTMMNELPGKELLKRFSVEDPVEYIMPGVRQISIQRGSDDKDEDVKAKFHSALRMLVRMDPDVVLIGEIRDSQSGQMASEMVQTGHRVLTTIHGESWLDALIRLTGTLINVPAEVICTKNFLSALMFQKLLPVMCPHCKLPAKDVMTPEHLELIGNRFKIDTAGMCCANVAGCEHCRSDGIDSGGTVGVTVVAEIFVPDDASLKFIEDRNWSQLQLLWRNTRKVPFDHPDMTGKTAFEHALYKAYNGVVDPRDIEADFESFASYHIVEREDK